ncbi:cilia- and flagella-associated protein 337-like isoform X3 [Nelusetta ayraudi]|uniref:cilia- and flagella-associated protein 337-like isoform X3 n=1 Tax=Nelusetta ayraudi TaxID=303726 RepID=UPI003F725DBA
METGYFPPANHISPKKEQDEDKTPACLDNLRPASGALVRTCGCLHPCLLLNNESNVKNVIHKKKVYTVKLKVIRMETGRNNRKQWVLYDKEVPHRRFCDQAGGVSPAERLSPEHLLLLRNAFTGTGTQTHPNGPNRSSARRRRGDGERGVYFKEFREVLRSVIGPDIEDEWIERFFNEREPMVRVVAVSSPPPLRYISVSKGGQTTVWSSSLHALRSLGLAGDPTEEVANTRRFRGWTTDAVSMANAHKVAIATDCRDLHFINVSTSSVFEDVHLFGFRSVPTALCYWYDVECGEQPSLLLLGDEKGGVHLLWFLKPSRGLFKSPSKKENLPQRIFFPDLSQHSDMVSYRHIPNIHQEPINRVMYEPAAGVVMTSSESPAASVIFTNLTLKRDPCIWGIKEGVKCFDYSATLQLMATGGCDRAVRLWIRFVTSHPVAVLLGHSAAVLDVAIYQPARQILSYSRDAELRVWDISSHRCLKSVRLQFPCQQPAQILEHGNFPFLLPSPSHCQRAHLVVGCKDYLALLPLAEGKGGEGDWSGVSQHSSSGGGSPALLSCALYNPTLMLLVTGHGDSSVFTWDVETGRRRLHILNAHGEEEVTCLALDSSHRRLITAACSGTIKVWNLLSGLNLHKLEPVTNSAVTGLTCLKDNKLLAVGWSQRIAQYDIAAAKDLYVKADMWWKSAGVHKSDILAVSQCATLGVVATASHDADLVVWRLETQGAVQHLHRSAQSGAAPPIDGLLFLQRRAGDRQLKHRGVLVSSQGGRLSFWSVSGQARLYGQFYAPEQPGQRVLSLGSDQTGNTVLVCGHSSGWLQVWDICHFAAGDQQQPEERPPLLRSWKAHNAALLSVDVAQVADRSFVLAASADGSTSLWTSDGDGVGQFGQAAAWSLTEAATYQRRPPREATAAERARAGDSAMLGGVKVQVPGPANSGQNGKAPSGGMMRSVVRRGNKALDHP